jgi:hypothetical protein
MQTPDNHQEQDERALQAPKRLVSALKRLPRDPLFIPPTVDEAILRAAAQHLDQKAGPRFRWVRFLSFATAAAAAVILVLALPLMRHPVVQIDTRRVDILDAFALARQLRDGAHPGVEMDLNHDGVVDTKDVTALAERAVSLGKGGRS